MKLAEVLNHDHGLEMSYLVGCYQRYRLCDDLSHKSQTSLCRYELYQEELNLQESQALLNAISLYHSIQSPRVYHFGRIGMDEFRRQSSLRSNELKDIFELTPTKYNPNDCEEFKKRAESRPFIEWNTIKIGMGVLGIVLSTILVGKKISLCFRIPQNSIAQASVIPIAKNIVQDTEKLAAGFLTYYSLSIFFT